MGPRRLAWLVAILLGLGLGMPLHAGWFTNKDKEARTYFEKGDFETAAETFRDEYRRGVALYRAGRYEEAARAFEAVDRDPVALESLYNLGNARYRLEQFAEAVQAYDPDAAAAERAEVAERIRELLAD